MEKTEEAKQSQPDLDASLTLIEINSTYNARG